MSPNKTFFSHLPVPAIALVVAVSAVSAVPVKARTFRFDYTKELAIESGAVLRIQNAEGNISVKGQTGLDHLVIQAVKTVHAVDESAAQEVAGFIKLKLSANSREARIETVVEKVENQRRSFWQRLVGSDDDWFESVDYVISAPIETSVMIVSGGGEITVGSFSGDLDISAPTSVMVLSDIKGNALLDITSGEITIREIAGNIDLTSTRANVTITSLFGDLTINGGSGDLSCEYIEGNVNVVQTSGDVTLQRLRGDARVKGLRAK